MILHNQRGSTLVETALAAPVIGMILVACAVLLYLAFAKVWMNRAAREAAICLASPSPPSRCRIRLENTLKAGLPIGQTEVREFRNSRYQTRVSLRMSFGRIEALADAHTDAPTPTIESSATFRKPRFFPRGE